MGTYTLVRTMQYTEVVEVVADSLQEAIELASCEDGERQNDDSVIDIQERKHG